MTAIVARRLTTAIAVVFNLVLTACGGGGDGGGGGVTQPPPPDPTVVSILFDCGADTTMLPGADRSCTAEAMMSDGTKRVVTRDSKTIWTAIGPISVVPGKVTAMSPGAAEVSVTYDGKTATVKLLVKPDGTPWSELPVQTTEEQRRFISSTLLGGRVTPWGKKSPTVWVNPGLSATWRADFDSASSYWKDMTDGQVSLALVTDSAGADITVSFNPALDSLVALSGACGEARWSVSSGYIVKGVINFSTIASCRNWFFIQLAHDFGHVLLGTRSHTPGCGDVLGSPCAPWEKSEFLRGVSKFLYLVPPGTKPV